MSSAISLDEAIPSWGAETLQNFDTKNIREGEPLSGSRRQFVRFYKKKFWDLRATKATIDPASGEARAVTVNGVEVEREFVQVITPGEKNEIDTFAADFHKRQFWAQYKAFREGRSAPIGTPIDECSFVSGNIATELRYHGVQTLEQLADASDLLCGQVPSGWEVREFARALCKTNLENQNLSQVNHLKSELETAKTMIQELQRSMKVVENREPALEAPKKNKGGRPKKIIETVAAP